jgi:exodeoxyribonuclease VII large subunit
MSSRSDYAPRRDPASPVYTVSQFTRELRALLESAYDVVRIRGQISNLSRPRSGHLYFSLVDDESGGAGSRSASAQIGAVMWRSAAWRLRFELEAGMKVVVTGRLSLYEPRGVYQVVAERIEPVGMGELQIAFEQLKARLEREGLFDPARKRPVPFLPRRVGVVTSPSGAALRDFLRMVFQRHPRAWVRLVPVRVQGAGAAEEVARAIDLLQAPEPQVDVVVVTRGGGSLEDLWAFNEECVARALARSRIPTISAVGHEIDFTIADFVADRRAPTPTAAAECAVPDLGELLVKLDGLRRRQVLALRRTAQEAAAAVEYACRSRFFRDPQIIVEERFELLDDLAGALRSHLRERTREREEALRLLSSRLHGLSPYSVLSRGYAVVTDSRSRLVKDAGQLEPGEEVQVRFHRGRARCVVREAEQGEQQMQKANESPGDDP